MELALDKRTLFPAALRTSSFPYAAFTSRWQSSKLPFTAATFTFAPRLVVICLFWTAETPSSG